MKWSTVNIFGRGFRVLASALALSLLPPIAVASALPSTISSVISTPEFRAVLANKKVPVISGTLRVPNQLSVSNGTWTGVPTTFTYQWLRCTTKVAKALAAKPAQCTEISGANASTYTLTDDDASKFVIARVGGSNTSGGKTIFTPAATAITPRVIAPRNTVVPAISGTAQVSRVLTVSNGTWIESPEDYSYQWYRCAKPIKKEVGSKPKDCKSVADAIDNTYQLLPADSGKFLTAVVTSSNTAGSANSSFAKSSSKISNSSAYAPSLFAAPNMYFEVDPGGDPVSAISGAASLGSVLVASKGQWLGFPLPEVTYSYWYRCDLPHTTAPLTRPADCYAIPGSTGETYLVTGDDVGKYLFFEVIATNATGTIRYFTPTTDSVVATPTLITAPVLSGSARYGQMLSVTQGFWSVAPGVSKIFTYDWYRCSSSSPVIVASIPTGCNQISGQTEAQYSLGTADVGKYIIVVENVTNSFGETVAATSNLSAQVLSVPTLVAAPTVSGTRQTGNELSVSAGSWTIYPLADSTFQWYRCTSAVPSPQTILPSQCSAISGESASTYSLTAEDSGQFITSSVSKANGLGSLEVIAAVQSTDATAASPDVVAGATISFGPGDENWLQFKPGVWAGHPTPEVVRTWIACDQRVPISVAVLPSGCELLDGFQQEIVVELTSGYLNCAKNLVGEVFCWGGRVPSTDQSYVESTPQKVVSLEGSWSIANRVGHACAVFNLGAIKCWGNNDFGQVTRSSPVSVFHREPTTVKGVSGATKVAVGEAHTCALFENLTVSCWGLNQYGQVSGAANATDLVSGSEHSCALLKNTKIRCWGRQGRLGSGSVGSGNVGTPSNTELIGAVDLSAGDDHSCAVLDNGTVWCWGITQDGRLGSYNSTSDRSVKVSGLTEVQKVSAGSDHTCALKIDGSIWCWGDNSQGEFGPLEFVGGAAPRLVEGIPVAVDVVAGKNATCIISTHNTVWCWGDNSRGQMGDGSFNSPVLQAKHPDLVSPIGSKLHITEDIEGLHIALLETATNGVGTTMQFSPSVFGTIAR